ncbi:MAG: 30S ribosomal protein S9 [Patescibacteria group bacterium]|jgi:small subunit ribosomal protein S9
MEKTLQLSGTYYYGVGRRKTASAEVRLYKGDGKITIINGQVGSRYFSPQSLVEKIYQPLEAVGLRKDFDISIQVHGGGMAAQADAACHGIARALVAFDANLKTALKKTGFLTRDARAKERKKFGLKRARRAPQFSKR